MLQPFQKTPPWRFCPFRCEVSVITLTVGPTLITEYQKKAYIMVLLWFVQLDQHSESRASLTSAGSRINPRQELALGARLAFLRWVKPRCAGLELACR